MTDVLVITKRPVRRVENLYPEEAIDLMLSSQKVGKVIEKYYEGTSLTMVIQDGPEAGQTVWKIFQISVPHVHMHVIPRKANDYANNDDIYDDIDHRKKRVDNEERQPRTEEDMAEEADRLRVFFEPFTGE
ncbi:hypothetical protein EC973_004117 [Apophysomyces ossiformis]|uniref:HIT domain-containing protein n=1 Tax=Apophysomyces ossiformis TaxID=679940 RepID=A0A8H7BKK3_9FUNG|nr:hypothetical protein EC973_004117 [Apophysomyces ossiformis]